MPRTRSSRRFQNSLTVLLNAVSQDEEQTTNELENMRINGQLNTIEEAEDLSVNPLFNKIKQENGFVALTNFNETKILDIYYRTLPHYNVRTKGPKPAITCLDAVLLLLITYKTNNNFGTTAALLGDKVRILKKIKKKIRKKIRKKFQKKFQKNSKKNKKFLHII